MALHRYLHTSFVVAVFLLGGCAPPPPKPTTAQATLTVTADMNPGARGRASPVAVRLFELKMLDAFQSADFFSLVDRNKETLGSELLAREETLLRPREKKYFARQLQADTHYVAAVAAFRDLKKSTWRVSIPVRLNQATPITIILQARNISLIDKWLLFG